MKSKNQTSTPCLVSPTNKPLTKTYLKITNQTKMLSKPLLGVMNHLNKREEMKTKKTMKMKRWSKKTKIMRKKEKTRRMAKMKKRLRTIKKSTNKKKRARLRLVRNGASNAGMRSLKTHHHPNSSKITLRVSKIRRMYQREGKERENFRRLRSLRYPLMKLTKIHSSSSRITLKKINRWQVRVKRKREKMKKTMMKSRLRKKRKKRMEKRVKMTRTMSLEKMTKQKGYHHRKMPILVSKMMI